MTVYASKPEINVREKLKELEKPSGIAGRDMLRAETPQEQFNLIGAGRRNLVMNGAMQHWQRGISNTSVNDGVYLADRFTMRTSNNGWFRADQSTDAPEGFPYSLKITSLGSNTPSSGAYIFLSQKIEGFNTVPLAYGTASAKTVTLSFYVRSSLAGTHGGAIRNNAQNRSYPFSYTINAIDTWEYKTITIVGDTTGTWVGATNGIGLELMWNLGSGSLNIGTAGAWQSAGKLGATGEVNIVSTNGATLYLTSVQLELGQVATPFEHRSYGEELEACRRYYYKWQSKNGYAFIATGYAYSTVNANIPILFPTELRSNPTFSYSGNWRICSGSCFNGVTLGQGNSGANAFSVRVTSSGLTVGNAYGLGDYNDTSAYLAFDAEL